MRPRKRNPSVGTLAILAAVGFAGWAIVTRNRIPFFPPPTEVQNGPWPAPLPFGSPTPSH